jgi:DNA-binding CsgD family transcriptional regulator
MNPMLSENGKKLRDTGLKAVGEVPWGTHFCIFYETKQDLLDILIPYFETGIKNNEFCVWVVSGSELLTVSEAIDALRDALPGFDRLSKEGRIEIINHDEWFRTDGVVDLSKVMPRFQQRLDRALAGGFSGMRFNGSSAWIQIKRGAKQFHKFEQELDALIASQRLIVACTFPLTSSGAEQIMAAVSTHQFAVTVRNGTWMRVQIADVEDAVKEEGKLHPEVEQLPVRQREVLQLLAEEKNTKEIAAMLEISVKTVEAHRLQLMRRLKIDNVPGLVRFAIRTGLVSAEP